MSAKMNPPTTTFPYTTITLDTVRLVEVTEHAIAARIAYSLGAKAASPDATTTSFHRIDCSGFVGWALSEASYDAFTALFGLGSVEQHDFIICQKFKVSSVGDAFGNDDIVRIAFLTPEAGGGIGHVLLVLNGLTLESHGGKGVDRRSWNPNTYPFMGRMDVYVLTAPPTS